MQVANTRLFAPSHLDLNHDISIEHFMPIWKTFATMAAPNGMADKQTKKYNAYVDKAFKPTGVDIADSSLTIGSECGFTEKTSKSCPAIDKKPTQRLDLDLNKTLADVGQKSKLKLIVTNEW